MTIEECIKTKQIEPDHIFLKVINKRIGNLMMGFKNILKAEGSIENIKKSLQKAGAFGSQLAKSQLTYKSAAKFELPENLLHRAIILDFGKEIMSNVIFQMASNKCVLRQNFRQWSTKLCAISSDASVTSNNLSLFGGLNYSTFEEFKNTVS